MTAPVRTRLILGLLLLAALAGLYFGLVAPHLRVETDLLALLPRETADVRAQAALEEFSERSSRKLLVLVGAASRTQAHIAAQAFSVALTRAGGFEAVHAQAGEGLAALRELYAAHRGYLLARSDQLRLERGQREEIYRDALRALYTPAGFSRPFPVARDPLGLGADYLLEQLPQLGAARLDGDQLVVLANDKTYVLIVADTAGSAFSQAVQTRAMAALQEAKEAARVAGATEVLTSGVLPHATRATHDASTEVSIFGTIATVGVLALMLALFRRWQAPALGMLAIMAGAGAGISATHFIFGELHLIALVFGSSLIGVAIDYSMHFFSDQYRDPDRWVPTDALAHVGRPILLGMAATILGYAGLLFLPFPGLRQMAVISIAGLLVASATVFLLFPALARGSGRPLPAWCGHALDFIERTAASVTRGRGRWVAALLVAIFLAIGLARIHAEDNIRSLQPSYPELLANERAVRELLKSTTETSFFLVLGRDAQQLLENEERLSAALDEARAHGVLDSYITVSRALPSLARQKQVHELLAREVYAPRGVLPRLMGEMGFEEAAVSGELGAIAATAPLTPEEWLASPASLAYRDLWLGQISGHFASVVTLGGIHDSEALSALAQHLTDVRFINRVADISAILARYRVAVSTVLLIAYALIGLALAWRYGWRAALWLIAAPLGATVLTVAFAGLVGLPFNLFGALALLLLLALGVDYAIFMREAASERRAALLAVSLSATTTMLSFGLLAFSSTPFIRSIGLTLFVGIGCCWLLAAAADALLGRGRAADHGM